MELPKKNHFFDIENFNNATDMVEKNRMRMILSVILVIVSITVTAQTFYIDPSGDDVTGNGSADYPWKSLYKACQVASMRGNIIHINPGTYVENTTCLLAPGVSIVGSDAKKCIITSTSLTTQFTAIINALSSEGTDGNQSISNLTFDGNNETIAQAFNIRGRSDFSIHDCIFEDFNYVAVYWSGRGDVTDAAPDIWATGNSFYNNLVTNCAAYADGYARGALMIGGMDGMLIYNNYITQTGRPAGENGWPLKVWVNSGYVRGVKIFNNILFKDDLTNWDFCIEMDHVSGVEIYDNTITGSIDTNHQSKGDYDYSIYIHDNIIGPSTPQNSAYYGVILEFETDAAIIARNHFRNVALGIMYSCREGSLVSNNEIYYNIFSNIGQANGSGFYGGIRFIHDGSRDFSVSDYFVYNNIFEGNPDNKPFVGIEMNFDMTSAQNVNIANNIFTNFSYAWFWSNRGGVINNLNMENNILFSNGSNNEPDISGGTPSNYININNTITDPLFYSSTNYHLQEGSPGIGAGLSLAGLTSDFEGVSVNNPPNIGAYETLASNAVPNFVSANIEEESPTLIIVSFDVSIDQIIPGTSAFQVEVNKETVDLSSIDIDGGTVYIYMVDPVYLGDLIAVSYTKPESNALRSIESVEARSFSHKPVANNVKTSASENSSVTILLYPNPATDYFNVLFEGEAPPIVLCRIFDLSGGIHSEMELPTYAPQRISTRNLPANGIYIIQVTSEKKIIASGKLAVID